MGNDSQSAKDQKTSISPMLSVRHGAKAVEFYKAAFGAGESFRLDAEVNNATEHSCGLWQINVYAHPQYNVTQLLSSASYNATAAHKSAVTMVINTAVGQSDPNRDPPKKPIAPM